ncbi:hypothetical protein N0V85_003960 [Neurospora sp. IMI 360204]|nr:hypothetical protein N0V85_003960 [Neurospora sp. IMI 360204]
MPTDEGSNCLGIAQDHAIPPRQTKRLLEESGSDTDKPVKKRPKTSEEDDLTRDHLAAFLEDTRATGKAGLWYDAHQKLYDHLKERRAKMREDTSIHHAVDTPSQVAAHSDSDISEKGRGPSRNFFEVLLLGRLETALEQHYRQHHDKNRPNTAEDPRSTTDSPPSNLPSPRTHKVSPQPPAKSSISTRIENMLGLNGIKADPARSCKAKRYTPARRSRGGPQGTWSNPD